MIVGIGNDIIEINRIEDAVHKPGFLERYFTASEIELFNKRKMNVSTIAGNFAAKEAVSKVLGTGIRGFALTDIEVLRDELGKPFVNLYREAASLAEQLSITQLHVSISHSKEYATAFALGENR